MNEHPNSPSEINQTALRDVTARDITANIDQSVNKTVIYQAPKVDRSEMIDKAIDLIIGSVARSIDISQKESIDSK